jgi:cell fate (sporulation/competence/biofilm development) regulator YmcA (YheA/YmcA/DUF963 family)
MIPRNYFIEKNIKDNNDTDSQTNRNILTQITQIKENGKESINNLEDRLNKLEDFNKNFSEKVSTEVKNQLSAFKIEIVDENRKSKSEICDLIQRQTDLINSKFGQMSSSLVQPQYFPASNAQQFYTYPNQPSVVQHNQQYPNPLLGNTNQGMDTETQLNR